MRSSRIATTLLVSSLIGFGCEPPPRPSRSSELTCSGLCGAGLQSGTFADATDQIAYSASGANGAYAFTITDPASGAVLATSTVTGESTGTVTITGTQPFDGTVTPSDGDLAAMDDFNGVHGASIASVALLLDWQGEVDPADPTQLGEYAALVQLVQTLQIYQGDSSVDLTALASALGTGYFDPASTHAGALSFGYASTGESAPAAFPFVGTYNFLGDGSALVAAALAAGGPPAPAAQAAPIPNQWLCAGTPYRAGCRHMCGPSCNAATTSSSIRCTDGILWRDTVYTGVTNVCCALHDDGYDACSARYNCGVGNCKTIVVPIARAPFFRVIRISCATMVEICRRVPDLGCAACAVANGYPAAACLLWIAGRGPGTPISFVDTTRVGTCCPRCANLYRLSNDGETAATDCVCETPDGGAEY